MEVIVTGAGLGDTGGMRRVRLACRLACLLASLAAGLGACSEGFEATVWQSDDGTMTLSLFDGGAAWEEGYVSKQTGEPVLTDGLRFEGVFAEGDDALDVDVSCVRAENARLAEPCDTKVVRELACVLVEDDETRLVCKVGKASIELVREGGRVVTR